MKTLWVFGSTPLIEKQQKKIHTKPQGTSGRGIRSSTLSPLLRDAQKPGGLFEDMEPFICLLIFKEEWQTRWKHLSIWMFSQKVTGASKTYSCLEPKTTSLKWMFGETTISYVNSIIRLKQPLHNSWLGYQGWMIIVSWILRFATGRDAWKKI